MDFKKIILAAGLLAASMSASATATVVQGTSLQGILDGITVGGSSSIDVNDDQVSPDSYWENTDSGITPTRFVAEIAGNAGINSFGIYDRSNPATTFTLFSGGNTVGDATAFGIALDGSVWAGLTGGFADTGIDFSSQSFGFYLQVGAGTTFYSDASLNGDNDQMVAYQGGHGDFIQLPGGGFSTGPQLWTQGGYVLAFEDVLYSNSDKDFDDLVVFIESARPVAEPGSIALLGLGLVGLGIARRRQAKA